MAQDFEKVFKSQVTNSAHTLLTSNSDDAIIGIRLTNITTSAIIVYLADDLSIAPKSSIELIQGGSKIVMQNTDLLRVQSSASTSCAAYVSYIDAIST
jgi:hypothetical protein